MLPCRAASCRAVCRVARPRDPHPTHHTTHHPPPTTTTLQVEVDEGSLLPAAFMAVYGSARGNEFVQGPSENGSVDRVWAMENQEIDDVSSPAPCTHDAPQRNRIESTATQLATASNVAERGSLSLYDVVVR